jgi:hypothetical protein
MLYSYYGGVIKECKSGNGADLLQIKTLCGVYYEGQHTPLEHIAL